jgi:hypothetical protein
MTTLIRILLAGLLLAGLHGTATAADAIRVWAADPHTKIFRDTKPAEQSGTVALRAARNEYEPGQIAIRAAKALDKVRVELSPLKHTDGKSTIGGQDVGWNFVGFIPLKKNTGGADKIQVRAAPCEMPDPLLDTRTMNLPAETTQPVWLTVRVPKEAMPGVYRGEVAVVAGDARAVVPVELTVDPFILPDARHVWVTNWFTTGNIAKAHKVEAWSEPFWAMLERYARNMAAHRQNVALVPWSLVQVTREENGKLVFNYERFDRYVQLFERAGVGERLEISHVGHAKGGWGKQFELSSVSATDRKTGKAVSLSPEEGLPPLLADLERHLDQRGWLAKSMIHVADEPILTNLDSWHKLAAFVHKAAPRLRRIEAIETIDCSGGLEVWVPQLSHFDRWREAYEARRGDGEFWYYICCNPHGNLYPNRFLDIPLSHVRVLHWVNFSEKLVGYLHWGLNYWGSDPFGTPGDRLPPGDTHVIYPGSEGPLDSIRWEIQRESLEDFEYLHLLTSRMAEAKKQFPAARWLDPERRAMELCRRVVPSITTTELDPAKIQAVRRQLAEEIMALDQAPTLLVQTDPPAGSMLALGPIAVEVRGLTVPGAKVKVNGAVTEVRADGTFISRMGVPLGKPEIRVEAEHGGKKKTTVRAFATKR